MIVTKGVQREVNTVVKGIHNDYRVSEFVDLPNHGHVALMDLVRDLLLHPKPVLRKSTRKCNVLDRNIVSSLLRFCVCVCVSDVYGSQSMVEQFDK